MFTDSHLFFWVTSIAKATDEHVFLDGLPFDDEHGLGGSNKRAYHGIAFIVEPESITSVRLEITLGHMPRRGTCLVVPAGTLLPEPPFLLTSRTNVRELFSDRELRFNDGSHVIAAGDELSIKADCWCGIFRFGQDKSLSATVFGESPGDFSLPTRARLAETGAALVISEVSDQALLR